VFINVPYDAKYQPLFLALIAGLAGLGLVPQAVLQIPGSQRRLDRLFDLIQSCKYSIHDLSRVELDTKHPRTPRFNMPFELGLAVAWSQHRDPNHKWFVFESKRYRLSKSLSDLDGTQVYVHEKTPIGILRQLSNALARKTFQPTVLQLQAVYLDVKKAAVGIKKNQGSVSLYDTKPFLDLVYAASISARKRIVSPRRKS
jgi:hypothetical protein